METQNEKGGSMGSGRGKGPGGSEGPGKMNTGSGSVSGASASSGRGASGTSGSTGSSGRGSDSGTRGSSGTSGRGSDSPNTWSSGSSGRSSEAGLGSAGSTGTGNDSGRSMGGNTGSATATKTRSRQRLSERGDGMLSDIGVNKNQVLTALGVVAGGALLYKGAKALTGSGKDASLNKKAIIDIKTSVTVKKPKEELYAYWRNFENLPNFMSHIEDVRELSDKRSEWTAEIPGGMGTIEWEAEIIWEQKNHSIAWRSLPDSEIENSGEVRFQDAGNGKSTVVETRISYRPPAGKAGAMAAKLLNPAFKKVVENDLKEFKKFMENGGASRRSSSRM